MVENSLIFRCYFSQELVPRLHPLERIASHENVRKFLCSAFERKDEALSSFLLNGLASIHEANVIRDSFLSSEEISNQYQMALVDIKPANLLLDTLHHRIVSCTPLSFCLLFASPSLSSLLVSWLSL
jgi:hypothetical protein